MKRLERNYLQFAPILKVVNSISNYKIIIHFKNFLVINDKITNYYNHVYICYVHVICYVFRE